MRIQRIYLETTMFNYYFDSDRDAHPDTVKLFSEIKDGIYEGYTSEYTVDELMKAPEEKSRKMLDLIKEYNITVFRRSVEVNELAALYQDEGVLPKRSTTDARHIAIATINDMDMILSLNFEHIVRKKTVLMTGNINIQQGYKPVDIRSPMEVVNRENS